MFAPNTVAALFGSSPYKILLSHHPHKNTSPHITFYTSQNPFKPTKINTFPWFYVSHSLQRPENFLYSHHPFNPLYLISHYNKKGDTPPFSPYWCVLALYSNVFTLDSIDSKGRIFRGTRGLLVAFARFQTSFACRLILYDILLYKPTLIYEDIWSLKLYKKSRL